MNLKLSQRGKAAIRQPHKLKTSVRFRALQLCFLLASFSVFGAATVNFQFYDIASGNFASKKTVITSTAGVTTNSLPGITVGLRRDFTNDADGLLSVTNLLPGSYKVDCYGSPPVSFYILLTNETGTVDAHDIVTSSTNVSANLVAYSQAAANAKFVLKTNGTAYSLTASNTTLLGTTAPVSNYVWTAFDSTGLGFWKAQTGSAGTNGGTVTSVGLSAPDIFSVSGSPVTDLGTLAITLATQTANKVFAGPTNGSAAAPSFRALISDDIPVLPYVGTNRFETNATAVAASIDGKVNADGGLARDFTATNLTIGVNPGDPARIDIGPDFFLSADSGVLRFNRTDGPSEIFKYDNSVDKFIVQEWVEIQEGLFISSGMAPDALTVWGGYSWFATNDVYFGLATNTAAHFDTNGNLSLPNLSTNSILGTGANDKILKSVALSGLTYDGTTLMASGGSGSGETNTASNLGGGYPAYDSKSGVDLRFNTFTNDATLTVSSNANLFTFGISTLWQNKILTNADNIVIVSNQIPTAVAALGSTVTNNFMPIGNTNFDSLFVTNGISSKQLIISNTNGATPGIIITNGGISVMGGISYFDQATAAISSNTTYFASGLINVYKDGSMTWANNAAGVSSTGVWRGDGSELTNIPIASVTSLQTTLDAKQTGSATLSNIVSQTATSLNLASATNISAGSFMFATNLTPASATNITLDVSVGAAVYKRILATNDVNFLAITNTVSDGPGAFAAKVIAAGGDRVVSWPTNWPTLYTNGLTISGAYFTATVLSNRQAIFSGNKDAGSSTTNILVQGLAITPFSY